MDAHQSFTFTVGVALSIAFAANGLAQDTNRYAVTYSLDPASPDVSVHGTHSAAAIYCDNSTDVGTTSPLWLESELYVTGSLPPYPNINAASDGEDVLPLPTAGCRQIWIEYTVSQGSQGAVGSWVEKRADPVTTTDPGGPANDIFGMSFHQDMETGSSIESDYLIGLENGVSSDSLIDALLWPEVRRGDVYFSVDTVLSWGPPVGFITQSDIMVWDEATGSVQLWARSSHLGLSPSGPDDIDALAIDLDREILVFSLAPGSPSIATYVPGVSADAATLFKCKFYEDSSGFIRKVSGSEDIFYSSTDLYLAGSDDLTGVRVADPSELGCRNSTQPDPSHPWDYEQLKITGTSGNVDHVVFVPLQSTQSTFDIDMIGAKEFLLVFSQLGRPCTSSAIKFPPSGGWLSFTPLPPFLPFGVVGSKPVSIPIPTTLPPITVTFQGIFQGPVSGINTTNMITMERG